MLSRADDTLWSRWQRGVRRYELGGPFVPFPIFDGRYEPISEMLARAQPIEGSWDDVPLWTHGALERSF